MRARGAATLALALSGSACFGGVFGTYELTSEGAGGRGHSAGAAGAATGGTAGGGAGGAGGTAGSGAGGASGSGASAGAPPVACTGTSEWACDPTSTAPCAAPGSACDIDVGKGVFTCFPPPNALALGAPCKLEGPEFCEQGSTCLNGACARFCCGDTACQGGNKCLPGNLPGVTVGLCACDPSAQAALGPTLANLAQQYAPGATAEGAPLCGSLAPGGVLQKAVMLTPGRCYTAVGVAETSMALLVLSLTTMPPAGMTPTVLVSSAAAGSPAPVLGAQPGCYKPTGTAPVAAVFSVTDKSGTGNVTAQLYSK